MINPASPDYLNTPVHPQRPCYLYRPADIDALPSVTIVTPFFYAAGDRFEETAQSVLRQSFQQWEWLIVNAGSTEADALDNLTKYQTLDRRIRIIEQPHKGYTAARNTGFGQAKTDLVVFLDGGHLLEPTALEKWGWFMESYPQYAFVDSYSVHFGRRQQLWPRGFYQDEVNLTKNQISGAAMVRRQVWREVWGGDETAKPAASSWEFWLKCAEYGYWGATIPEYLCWSRQPETRNDQSGLPPDEITGFRPKLPKKFSFPKIQRGEPTPYGAISIKRPAQNLLVKPNAIKKRVLLIMPRLALGGAEKVNLDLVEQLLARGYEISICTTLPTDNPWYAEFARYTPDIFILHHFLGLADYPRFLLYLINSRQIDTVLISNSYLGYQLLPFLRAHCPQVTFVDYAHSELESWRDGGYPRAGVAYQELLDLNIVSHQYLKNWMVNRSGDPDRIEVCYTNVDTGIWDPARFDRAEIRRYLGISPDIPLLFYGGRISSEKRPLLVVEVIRRLAFEENLNFACVITGDGPMLPQLKNFVQKHNLEQIIQLLGLVPFEQIKRLQAAADVFFLPSEYEGISVGLFEAMAMGTVPVAANVGGQQELVTAECGYLIPHSEDEIEEYVTAIKTLVESPPQLNAMSTACRERIANHFRLDQMTDRMIELLNQAEKLSQVMPRLPVGRGLGLECAVLTVEYNRLDQAVGYLWQQVYSPEASNSSSPQLPAGALPSKVISQQIPIRKLIKAIGHKAASKPGFGWLYRFEGFGKKLLGTG